MNSIHLDQTADGCVFYCHSGESIYIEIEENPTTGYRWQLSSSLIDPVISSTYASPDRSATGSSGVRIFAIFTTATGLHEITARLVRSWDPPDSYAQVIRFYISVQDRHAGEK